MTHQPPQRELFVSERPVRSDYGRERSYARRRVRTLAVVAFVIGGLSYALWGHSAPNPADIPTIKAEGAYKEKPANPGGIDIPHQDVQVYNELDGKAGGGASSQIEHLLPPPEVPKDAPRVAVPVTPPLVASPPLVTPSEPVAVAAPPEPVSAPVPLVQTNQPVAVPPKDEIGGAMSAVKAVETTVATQPVPVAPSKQVVLPVQKTAPPEAKALSITQILQETKAPAPASPSLAPAIAPLPKAVVGAGNVVIQLASTPGEAKAQSLMKDLQSRYASALGGTALHLARADLGARGIYYRVQSSGLAEGDANHICSALKQMNAGCILVRK